MNVKTRITNYLRKAIAEEIGDDDDIFELGVVSSLFAMQLVEFLEREFSITTEREDLDIKNFCSIAAMTNFVQQKLMRPEGLELGNEHQTE